MIPQTMSSLQSRAFESGSRQVSVYGVGIAFVAFIMLVILARVHVRVVMLRALGTDDVLMVIGTIIAFGLTGASMAAAYYGVGRHINDIPSPDKLPMLKSVWATRILYVLSQGIVKMSLLVFYLRLDPRRFMRWSVYFLLFVEICLSIASFFVLLLACIPPSKFWDITGTVEGRCMGAGPQQDFYEINGILNIITDTLIYLLPIPMLWNLRISTRRKGALLGVFGLGVLAIAAGGVRYDFVKKLENNPDQYYYLADSLNWCCIEVYVAIFCGSAPALAVLVKRYAPTLLGSSGPSKGHIYPMGQGPSNRFSTRPSNHHRLEDTTSMNGSEEEIISGRERTEGILMKTDIHMEVNDREELTQTHPGHCTSAKE